MSSPVKIVFVSTAENCEPWFGDLAAALAGDEFELVRLESAHPLAPQFKDARVVADLGGHGTRAEIDAAADAGVGLWQALTTGLDHTEVEYILKSGMRLANTPGEYSADALAEHAIFLMLSIAKQLHLSSENLTNGRWYEPVNDELSGHVLGLVGLGWSGRALARRASAFGMSVRAVDIVKHTSSELAELSVERCDPPEALAELLAASDYVSLHVPLTRETRGLIGKSELERMRPTSVLINIARGGLVDEEALVEALSAGEIRAAGIDVFAEEPPDPSHPLLSMTNVIATPHVAGVTIGTSRRRAAMCAENAHRFLDGQALLHEILVP